MSLTLPQARDLAINALNNDQPGLALQLAAGLLRANPRDAFAHFLIASAHAKTGNYNAGHKAAARAYRYSTSQPDKLRSAELTAKLAFADNRPTLAQIWLRRTSIHVESDADEKRIAKDYQTLRRLNPWSFSLRTGLRPSNNVNNGADSAANVIDGVPDGGVIPASAVALSGLIGTVDLQLGYRLRQSATSKTTLKGRLFVQRVSLSDGAKDKSPNSTNSDFGSTYAELGLRHDFAVGPKADKGSAAVEFTLGESWYRNRRNYQLARLSGERNWRFADGVQVQLNMMGERRFNARYLSNDAHIFGIGAVFGQKLENEDSYSISVLLRTAESPDINGDYQSATLRAGYTFGRAVGPAQLSTGLTIGYTQYDKYKFSFLALPTQRTDKSVYADLSAFFAEYDYAGFAPTLRLRVGRNKSNFSAFSTREVSLSVGIGSKF
ncbi:surface lipoprotein assembly modifier [Arenibacterium sp. CAU 1754]